MQMSPILLIVALNLGPQQFSKGVVAIQHTCHWGSNDKVAIATVILKRGIILHEMRSDGCSDMALWVIKL